MHFCKEGSVPFGHKGLVKEVHERVLCCKPEQSFAIWHLRHDPDIDLPALCLTATEKLCIGFKFLQILADLIVQDLAVLAWMDTV